MLNFDKQYDIKRAMGRIVSEDDLITAVFHDVPDLQEFTWSVTSEYDDNNYSTYCNLTSVNGRPVDYDADYEEEDEEEEESNKMPKIESREHRHTILECVHAVGEEWGYGEEHKVSREDYVPKIRRRNHAKANDEEIRYVMAYMSGSTLPDEYFENMDNPKWAIYYADDHGRFSPELEFKLFAKEGRMWEAFRYSQVIKAPLCGEVENFFILNTSEEDKKSLQIYLESKKAAA